VTAIAAEDAIAVWIGRHLGADIRRIERQGRWRPAWFVDAQRGGEDLALYVRGERRERFLPYSLRREHEIHRLLEAGGVRVPRLHGFIEDLPATVMERVAGQPVLAFNASAQEVAAVREQLVEQLVRVHALDTEPFHRAGLRMPENPVATTLSFFDDMLPEYRIRKRRSDPRLEFASAWVIRNAPPAPEPPRLILNDSGQFLCEGGQLKALIDFELAVFGAPLQDLAAIRARAVWQPMGDAASLIRLYGEKSGRKIDLQLIRYHTAVFMTASTMGAAMNMEAYLAQPDPDSDYVEFRTWVVLEQKQAIEAIAEYLNIELAIPPLPEPATSWSDEPQHALESMLAGRMPSDPLEQYRLRVQHATAIYLGNVARYGRQLEADYVRDVGGYLGVAPASAAEADLRLEQHIAKAGPDEDEALLGVVYADLYRRAFLLTMPGSLYNDPLMNPLPRL